MKAENQIKSVEPTPEQLLRLLDLQLEAARARREKGHSNRTSFRVMSILLIIGGLLAALLFLQLAVGDLPLREGTEAPSSGPVQLNQENF